MHQRPCSSAESDEHRLGDRRDRRLDAGDLEALGADRDDLAVAEAVERAADVARQDPVGAVGRRREPEVDPRDARCGPQRGRERAVLAGAVEQDAHVVVVAAQARDDRRHQRADRRAPADIVDRVRRVRSASP